MLGSFYRSRNIPLKDAFGGHYPACFTHPVLEYDALTGSCGVIDLTHQRVIRVRGADRARYLNAMLTSDVSSLRSGQQRRALMTTVKGKVVSELDVLAGEGDHLVLFRQGDLQETLAVLRKHVITEDVAIDDVSSDRAVMGVEGPESEAVIHRLLGQGPLPTSERGVVERQFERFSVLVTRGSVTGEPGCHVIAPADKVLRIRNYLVQAARGSDGAPVGLSAWGMRRVERGLPWYGVDFTGESFPQEVRLGDAVSYTKGCFRGQETLERLHHRGHVNRLLVGLVPEKGDAFRPPAARAEARVSPDTPEADAPNLRRFFPRGSPLVDLADVKTAGAPGKPQSAGFITSAVYSPALQKPLLLGLVRRESANEGRGLVVETPDGTASLRVIALPIKAGAA